MNLTSLREKRARGENGFTLIELLVVVVIIGILIAIAIPVYLNYKKGASDKSAESDLRNAISVLEQCNTDNAGYPTAMAGTGGTPTGCTGQTVTKSPGTTFKYYPNVATAPTGYLLYAWNSNGSGPPAAGTPAGKVFCYASVAGGSVLTKTATAPTAYAATC
jgi:type IV pilus assembly protein PilA